MESSKPHQTERTFMDEGQELDFINYCLQGSYNEEGITRWWERPRTELDGLTPSQAWGGEKSKVIKLAESITGQAKE